MPEDPPFEQQQNLAAGAVENIFACPLSLRIMQLVSDGVTNPNAVERALSDLPPGGHLDYVEQLIDLGVLGPIDSSKPADQIHYHLTEFGEKFLPMLKAMQSLQGQLRDLHDVVVSESAKLMEFEQMMRDQEESEQ